MKKNGVCFLLTVGALLAGRDAAAHGIVGACPGFFPHYTTIQQAVDAVPAGDTVFVCPGIYHEQVKIEKSLTLHGLRTLFFGAVITSPVGGMVPNTVSGGAPFPVAALIAVAGAPRIKIEDLIVDATGNAQNTCNVYLLAGIALLDSSGVVTDVAVRNVIPGNEPNCFTGSAIRIESSNTGQSEVTVSESDIRRFRNRGIFVRNAGTRVTITKNYVEGLGATGIFPQFGIDVGGLATGVVSSNRVVKNLVENGAFGSSTGILAFGGSNVKAIGNVVKDNAYGISAQSVVGGPADGMQVLSNLVLDSTRDGIWLCSNNNRVQLNTVDHSGQAGVHLLDNCLLGNGNGNVVTHNLVKNACAGILLSPTVSGNVTSPNVFFNAGTPPVQVAPGCPAP